MAAIMETAERGVAGANVRKGNKRAGQVCHRCHEKKIKCDINLQTGNGRRCGNCANTGSRCQIRQSRRGKKSGQYPSDDRGITKGRTDAPLITPVEEDSAPPQPYIAQSTLPAPQSVLENPTASIGPPPGEEYSDPTSNSPQHKTYLGNTGYMQMFSNENVVEKRAPPEPIPLNCELGVEAVSEDLIESYLETYFEYAYVWCPVLDRDLLHAHPKALESVFLQNAVALCGTRLRPPLMAHTEPEVHYKNAKRLLYGNCENNPVLQIIGIMLFYWWSPGLPSIASLDTGRWWVATAVRLAEEIGLHQDIQPAGSYIGETAKWRRRVWWTLFARDRIVAMAQGRPCVINPDYCSQPMVTEHDFPDPTDLKATIFVHWVRMWEIGGKIHKEMYWAKDAFVPRPGLVQEMIVWVQSLPNSIQLPFSGPRTVGYHRDVHDLHLGYFTIIILLYLRKSDGAVPTASIPAIAAASCIARIFKDYLARGSVRFVMTQATWTIALAILSLLHARRIERLKSYAEDDMQTLHTALRQLAPFSYLGKMFYQGIQKILEHEHVPMSFHAHVPADRRGNTPPERSGARRDLSPPSTSDPFTDVEVRWTDFFPYVTSQTSPLVAALLAGDDASLLFPEPEWPVDILLLHELLSQPHNFQPMDVDTILSSETTLPLTSTS